MCTAITLHTKQDECFLGRTMDFSYDIDPHVFILPRNFEWNHIPNQRRHRNLYRFIGIGQEQNGILAFFDGVNERGFAAAALYFAGYACYKEEAEEGKIPVASFDFLHYILGRCQSVEELTEVANRISIVGLADPVTRTAAPLHWIAADRTGACVVVEQTKDGLKLHQNPLGVMANSPDFPWHMTNLRNFMNTVPTQKEEACWNTVPLRPFGQGGGTTILPGGYTSPERFVRTAYLKSHCEPPSYREDAIMTGFHLLESVSIPKGAVVTKENRFDYTKYTAFMNINTCTYYFKTYGNSQVTAAGLWGNRQYSIQPFCLGSLNRPLSFERM